ncbi:hypothetical protein A2U01_0036889, partial [Trifolium medium]|nr:hypothetical protein [Trifolium medium]
FALPLNDGSLLSMVDFDIRMGLACGAQQSPPY